MPENPENSPDPKQRPSLAGAVETKPAIRTMRTDVAELLQKKKSSFAQIAGQEIAAHSDIPLKPPRPGIKIILTKWAIRGLFALFILLATAGVISLFISPASEYEKKSDAPRPYFSTEKERGVSASTADKNSLGRALRSIYGEGGRTKTITRTAITLQDGPISRSLTLHDFFPLMELAPPSPAFLERIEGPLMVFFYHMGPEENRLGFATRTRDPARTLRDLILWEPTLVQDVRPIFFNERLQFPAEPTFENKLFRNIDWRWLPLSQNSDLGLAYSVFTAKDLMIITTSRAEMEAVLTRLLDAQ
ncbi:MAG: hypothetical protein HYT98_03875 [Candidatus Sungbacteria bacterium]|nr:hypothetical protein [Candidatus Sungbacteria bacterium]